MTERTADAPAPPAWRLVLCEIDYGAEEEEAVLAVLRGKWLSMGPRVAELEAAFAAAIGVRHAVAVSNGTDALLLGLLALGIGPGDEVIQPAVNFVAAANVTVRLGARPTFADIVGLDEPTIDPQEIERLIGPRTRAVVAMHYGGAACRMEAIEALCRDRGIALIEDACHGVGGARHGRPIGAWGDLAAFSFFANKNLAMGEGGMVTTGHDELAARLRLLRSHGMTTLTWERHRGHGSSYDVVVNGLNCRLDEIRAALGLVQLGKLERNNRRRRALVRRYHARVRGAGADLGARGWTFPALGSDGEESAHHLMVALAPSRERRDLAQTRLREERIQSSVHYPFLPGFTAFRTPEGGARSATLERSRGFCDRVLSLPLHPLLGDSDVDEVVAALERAAAG